MSDLEIRAAIEQMEAWLADPAWEPDPDALATWNAGYTEAFSRAERGPGWPELVARARAAGASLDARAARMAQTRDAVKAQLEQLDRGHRALLGYGGRAR